MHGRKRIDAIIALCSMSFIVLASSATSPALSAIANSFPNASAEAIASIATLPSLTAVPFTLVSGSLVGNKVRFRTMAVIGLLVSTIGGFMPFFSVSIGQVLVGRALLGIGTGLLGPIVSTLTLSLFEGKEIAKQFSRNMMATNTGAVIFQLAGGALCNYSWRMPFYSYLVVFPVVVIVIFLLPEPHKIVKKNGELLVKKLKFSDVLSVHVIFWGIIHGMYMACFYAYVTGTAGIIISSGYGDSFTAAIVLSVFTALGVVGGYLFYPLNNKLGMRTFSVGFGFALIGSIGLLFAKSIYYYMVFTVVYGVGYGMLAPAINYYLGIKLNPNCRAAAVSVESLFAHIGSFGSPFMMRFFKTILNSHSDRFPFLIGMVFYLLVTILFFIHKDSEKSII